MFPILRIGSWTKDLHLWRIPGPCLGSLFLPVPRLTRMHFSLRVQTSGLTSASRARTFSFPGRKPHLGTVKKGRFKSFLIQQSLCHFPFHSHSFFSYLLSSLAYLFPSKRKRGKVDSEELWRLESHHLHWVYSLNPTPWVPYLIILGWRVWNRNVQWSPERGQVSHIEGVLLHRAYCQGLPSFPTSHLLSASQPGLRLHTIVMFPVQNSQPLTTILCMLSPVVS